MTVEWDYEQLTRREIECLSWLAKGLHSAQIASELNVARTTVDFHLTNARRKLKSTTREQAIARAVAASIIVPD